MPTFTTDQLVGRAKVAADVRDNFVTPDEAKQWATQERYSLDLFLAKSGWHQNFETFTLTSANNNVPVSATFSTINLDQPIARAISGFWSTVFEATAVGEAGNGITVHVWYSDTLGGLGTVEVRDGEKYNGSGWLVAANTVGILVDTSLGAPVAITAIEAAVNAASSLIQVQTPDGSGQSVNGGPFTGEETEGVTEDGLDGYGAGDYFYEPAEMMAVVAVHRVDSAGNIKGRLELSNTVDFLRQLPGSSGASGEPRMYRTRRVGTDVVFNFYPEPAAGDIMLVTYVPHPKRLVLVTDDASSGDEKTVNYPMGWEEYIVLGLTARIQEKEESDSSATLRRQERMRLEIEELTWTRALSEAPRVRNVDRPSASYDFPHWSSWAWL